MPEWLAWTLTIVLLIGVPLMSGALLLTHWKIWLGLAAGLLVIAGLLKRRSNRKAHLSEYEPDRFSSTDRQHFFAAYAERPFLMGLVGLLYFAVFAFGLITLVMLIETQFLKALGALVLAAATFLGWFILNNWALVHPKE